VEKVNFFYLFHGSGGGDAILGGGEALGRSWRGQVAALGDQKLEIPAPEEEDDGDWSGEGGVD
jgi:hypothetical protein